MREHLCVADKIDDSLFPLLMECIGTSRLFLIRTYPVETAHKDIAKLKCIQSVLDKAWSKLKARVLLETYHVD